MNKLHFTVQINAPREVVWNTLWEDASYREWTSVFMAGSYAESNWREGDKILFLAPDGSGMVSRITREIPNEVMSFTHEGEVKDGIEKQWPKESEYYGAQENYYLKGNGHSTELSAEVDVVDKENETKLFNDLFTKALEKVKELAEKQQALVDVR